MRKKTFSENVLTHTQYPVNEMHKRKRITIINYQTQCDLKSNFNG